MASTASEDPKADYGTVMLNMISWTEIPVQDVSRAQAFYKSIFSWDFSSLEQDCPDTDKKPEEPSFVMFSKGTCHGSLVKVAPENLLSPAKHPENPDKGRIAVRVTITVLNVDETMKAVEEAGGALYIPKKEIPNNMGFVAYFTDTEKNVMGLWSAK